ncbi:MAG: gamma-glutamyl-gamma-aminobutyrate hydrolase family protein [Acidimicrobiales bacterium]
MTTVAMLIGREPAHRHSVHRGYADAVWDVGGTPVLLVPAPAGAVDRIVSAALACDALCLTGGGDVDPRRYGEGPLGDLMDVDPARDEAEFEVVRAARAAGRPVLGICRGIQSLTVALGGTLRQDLPREGFAGHWEEEHQHAPVHGVSADPSTAALAALGGASSVNSIHHQAVRHPGPVLRASAWSDDGVIEAVEADGVLGVQWHPERLVPSDARHLAPFRWLVTA